MPIFSTETGEPVATLVVGFAPFDPPAAGSRAGMARGIWSEGSLHLPALAGEDARALTGPALRIWPARPDRRQPVSGDGRRANPCFLQAAQSRFTLSAGL